MTWDPRQYERFHRERSQPFFDLLALVRPSAGMRAVDLGSGTGELTRELHTRLACASTVGYESSPAMLEKAGSFAAPGLSFATGDIATLDLPDEGLDLVFSNAALHWIPDHARLFARLSRWIADGGQIAVQVPANFDHPSHLVAAEVAHLEPFRAALAGYEHGTNVLAPEAYAELLHGLGFAEQKVRLEVYAHVLPSRDAVVEWVKGTLITGYRERLGEALYPRFLEAYAAQLLPRLRDEKPYLYPFKRVLMWGARKA